MITQLNTNDMDKKAILSYEDLAKSTAKAWDNIEETLKKFQNLDAFFQEASDVIDYYFSIQSKYKEKEDFEKYLKWLLGLYVSYFSETFEEKDEGIETIIEYIEENYDFLLYYGEDINPIYRRLSDPNSSTTRKQLDENLKNRLIKLLS